MEGGLCDHGRRPGCMHSSSLLVDFLRGSTESRSFAPVLWDPLDSVVGVPQGGPPKGFQWADFRSFFSSLNCQTFLGDFDPGESDSRSLGQT